MPHANSLGRSRRGAGVTDIHDLGLRNKRMCGSGAWHP